LEELAGGEDTRNSRVLRMLGSVWMRSVGGIDTVECGARMRYVCEAYFHLQLPLIRYLVDVDIFGFSIFA